MLHKHLFKKYLLISIVFVASATVGFMVLFFAHRWYKLTAEKKASIKKKETPLAYLQSTAGYIALSKNGVVLYKIRSADIPHPAITMFQPIHHTEYQTGQKIGYTVLERTLTFILLLQDLGYSVETVAIDSVDMIACKIKGVEVVFSQTRPTEMQAHEARQIIRQIKAGVMRIKRLDLRFDKPVVQLIGT